MYGVGEFVSVCARCAGGQNEYEAYEFALIFHVLDDMQKRDVESFQMLVNRRPCCCVSACMLLLLLLLLLSRYHLVPFITSEHLTNSNKELNK